MTRWALVVIIGAIAGCASSPPPSAPRPSVALLVQADRLLTEGQYASALDAYGEILAKYPNTDEAPRARGSRDVLSGLLAARSQVTRLTTEMKTQDAQGKAQEGELQRARQEIARLTAEVERLRADLENLKKIDIDLERRRK